MKHTNLRKLFAVLMSAAMLFGVLAGCNNAGDTDTTAATGGTTDAADPIASGMLVVNANAAINVSYDSDGLVIEIEGIDDNGAELVAEYTDYLGESCSDVVCNLIKNSSAAGYLAESNYVMIKQAIGSELPGTNFLDELTTDAKAALETVNSTALLLVLAEEDLDENGYINLESAKELSLAYLNLSTFDSFDGTTAPSNGVYGFKITAGINEEDLLVDAVTGAVYPGVLDNSDEDVDLDVDGETGTDLTDDDEGISASEATTEPTATQSSSSEDTNEEVASAEG